MTVIFETQHMHKLTHHHTLTHACKHLQAHKAEIDAMKKKKKKKKRKEGRKLVCQLAKVTTQKISEGVGSKKTQSGEFFKNNLTSNKNFFTINNPSLCLSVCLSVYPTILDVLVAKHV
jgi:hypothetical protein